MARPTTATSKADTRSFDNNHKQLESFKGDGGGAHAQNFIDAVKSRDASKQNGEIEQVHYSSSWCHLANIAFRLGAAYDKEKALAAAPKFGPWAELVDGFNAHLEANKVDPKSPALKVSTVLELDPAKETFVGPSATPDALALLRREYRKGFEMPEQV